MMRSFLTLAAALALAGSAHAAPFLVADVSPEADTCTATGLPASVTATVPEAGGMCKWDMAGLPVSEYSVTATARNLWDTSDPSSPFAFKRPPSISTAGGWRLVP